MSRAKLVSLPLLRYTKLYFLDCVKMSTCIPRKTLSFTTVVYVCSHLVVPCLGWKYADGMGIESCPCGECVSVTTVCLRCSLCCADIRAFCLSLWTSITHPITPVFLCSSVCPFVSLSAFELLSSLIFCVFKMDGQGTWKFNWVSFCF